ncbi:triacylglycerol lipase [Tupanvirus soda lake]|uniref:Triacylglycerol lipase n=2 Tax=Tupanvirus TaxID=2094720 RepID=A0A6N1NTS3_9VIRU|nr:triacylglycerol lipase [Tupanvirus soda lake]QKU34978.1 triacylglycerol lipase [Tupanvirus soda lake]
MATISPVNAVPEHYRGMPPVLIITAENDILRDDGEKLAHRLMKCGIDVTAIRYLGTIHDFIVLDPLKTSSPTKSAIKLIVMHIKDILESK